MGPMAAMRDIATQAILGSALDQARDYAIEKVGDYYQTKGVRADNADILASGTVFGVETLAGRVMSAVDGAKQYVRHISGKSVENSSGETVILYRVDDADFAPRIASDGSVPVVATKKGDERALFINIGQPERAKEFASVNRGGKATITAVEVDASFRERLRATAIYDKAPDVGLYPSSPLSVDVNKASDQFGLRTPGHFQWLRGAIKPNTVRIIDPKNL